jgi:hypothetical protein
MQQSEQRRALVLLSPLIWPILFVCMSFRFFPPVPSHWMWDIYSYLHAAGNGKYYVPLGAGRTAFCLVGNGLADLPWITHPFELFRLWVGVGAALHMVVAAMVVLRSAAKWSLGAAHIFAMVYFLDADLFRYVHGPWPEVWATTALGAAWLALSGERISRTNLGVGAAFAAVMILFKEVHVAYIPFLASLFFLQRETQWRKAIGPSLWFVGVSCLASGLAYLLFYLLIEEMRTATTGMVKSHFSTAGSGIESAVANFRAALQSPSIPSLLLAGAGIPLIAMRFRENRGWVTVALLLIGPLAVVVLTAHLPIIERYWLMLLPGVAAAAAGSAHALLQLSRANSYMLPALIIVLGFHVADYDMPKTLFDIGQQRADQRNGERIERMARERAGFFAGQFTWSANLLARHVRAKCPIWWPAYDFQAKPIFPREWIEERVAEGRPLLIHLPVLEASGVTIEEFRQSFPSYDVSLHDHEWIEARPR